MHSNACIPLTPAPRKTGKERRREREKEGKREGDGMVGGKTKPPKMFSELYGMVGGKAKPPKMIFGSVP
jgi:hypothetical protein